MSTKQLVIDFYYLDELFNFNLFKDSLIYSSNKEYSKKITTTVNALSLKLNKHMLNDAFIIYTKEFYIKINPIPYRYRENVVIIYILEMDININTDFSHYEVASILDKLRCYSFIYTARQATKSLVKMSSLLLKK